MRDAVQGRSGGSATCTPPPPAARLAHSRSDMISTFGSSDKVVLVVTCWWVEQGLRGTLPPVRRRVHELRYSLPRALSLSLLSSSLADAWGLGYLPWCMGCCTARAPFRPPPSPTHTHRAPCSQATGFIFGLFARSPGHYPDAGHDPCIMDHHHRRTVVLHRRRLNQLWRLRACS